MITLALDASTYLGTAAVIRDGAVLADTEAAMRKRESETLMPAVIAVLTRAGVSVRDLSRVVCGAGPGSFTSLRIAASIAKGIAAGVPCPLYAVSSLALLAAGDGTPRPGRYLAALDALRGQAYVAGFAVETTGEIVATMPPSLVRQQDLPSLANSLDAMTIGPGQEVDRSPRARGALALESIITAHGPVDLGRWEPAYGRDAEAQVRWEAAHGQPLPLGGPST